MAYYKEVHYHHDHSTVALRIIANIVALAGGVLTLLLATRFILSAISVDRLTPIANFIYGVSYFFVAPFFALFQQPIGEATRFEYQTLIALVFWAAVTWLIAGLMTFSDEE